MRRNLGTTRMNAQLEDFGVRQTISARDRKDEYARQCRELPVGKQAPFWLKVMRNDPEVARLVSFKRTKERRR